MRLTDLFRFQCGFILLLFVWGALSTAQAASRHYQLATASTNGTYYPVGVALATLVKIKLEPRRRIGLSAIPSAGSGENIQLLRENKAQFAILQGLFGAHAWNGTGPISKDGPQHNLRAITMLWPNVEHWVIRKKFAKTGTITDVLSMTGHPLSLGRQKSGTIGSNRTILRNLGLTSLEDAFDLVYLGYGPSAEAFKRSEVAGMSTPAGDPVSAVTRVMKALGQDVVLLNFTDAQIKQADGNLGLFTSYVIEANTYPNQPDDIHSMAQPNFLAVRADVPDEDVYEITRTIYENLTFLGGIHRATQAMDIDQALTGLPIPLHPGALEFFEEEGLEIPDRLIAP